MRLDRRRQRQGELADIFPLVAGHPPLLVGAAGDRVDGAHAVEAGGRLLQRRQPALRHIEVGAGRQLGINEELTLDQLRHQLTAKARVERQAEAEQQEGDGDGAHRVRQHPPQVAFVDHGEAIEYGMKQLQRRPRHCVDEAAHDRGDLPSETRDTDRQDERQRPDRPADARPPTACSLAPVSCPLVGSPLSSAASRPKRRDASIGMTVSATSSETTSE